MPLPFRSFSGGLAMVAVVVVSVACASSITEPEGLVDYEPLPAYAEWYAELQRCAHVTGTSFDDVRWRKLPGATSITYGDTTLAAYWLPPGQIVISGAYVQSELIVKHEMLHHLLRKDPYHRDASWEECELLSDR